MFNDIKENGYGKREDTAMLNDIKENGYGKREMNENSYGKPSTKIAPGFEKPLRKKTLDRFRLGNAENEICWDRSPEEDSFFSIIDAHNHFYPFGGPAVPFNDYFQWMEDAGILFSTMFGIGQLIQKKKHEGKMI